MPLRVLAANEADAPKAAAIEEAAYGPNPIDGVLFPGPRPAERETRAEGLVKLLRGNSACRWAKVVDTDLADDEMVAFTMWYIWESPPKDSSFSSYRGPGSNPEACELLFGGLNKMRLEIMDGKPYAYLKLMHTDPKHQRRGAASLLMDWGLREADRLGIPSFLEASAEGRPLYEKFGFREVKRLTIDLSVWGGPSELSFPLMLRPVGGHRARVDLDETRV
ncbi:hypothetical protein FZEAL_6492 [Fusarium zealandicum]|uniref:N-acetyltransferase domain-containing protein n=1 Tax=Fusarium zealandicum TaxID=1053134 RepID=A0A8H4UIH2_9HYPO|nr:hypothetical protein FZEAL_6492 [Fusarium zealandicum]